MSTARFRRPPEGLFARASRRIDGSIALGAGGPRARGSHRGPAWGLATLASLALSVTSAPSHAFCRTTTTGVQPSPGVCATEGVPLAWERSCASLSPDVSVLAPGLTATVLFAELDRAMARWPDASCGTAGTPSHRFSRAMACTGGQGWNPTGRNANAVRFRTVWNDDEAHRPGAIALTTVTYELDSGFIRDTDTELNLRTETNPSGFAFSLEATEGTANLRTVLTHEIGHSTGLAHSARRDAVMFYGAGFEARFELTDDDIAGACAVHPPARAARCDTLDPYGGPVCGGCACGAPGARCGEASSASERGLGALALAACAGALRLLHERRRRRAVKSR